MTTNLPTCRQWVVNLRLVNWRLVASRLLTLLLGIWSLGGATSHAGEIGRAHV